MFKLLFDCLYFKIAFSAYYAKKYYEIALI